MPCTRRRAETVQWLGKRTGAKLERGGTTETYLPTEGARQRDREKGMRVVARVCVVAALSAVCVAQPLVGNAARVYLYSDLNCMLDSKINESTWSSYRQETLGLWELFCAINREIFARTDNASESSNHTYACDTAARMTDIGQLAGADAKKRLYALDQYFQAVSNCPATTMRYYASCILYCALALLGATCAPPCFVSMCRCGTRRFMCTLSFSTTFLVDPDPCFEVANGIITSRMKQYGENDRGQRDLRER